MRIVIERGDLLRALGHATSVVERRTTIPILSNVLLRAVDGGFDERRYGFVGLMDLLRACQREGWVRLERDRRGGVSQP